MVFSSWKRIYHFSRRQRRHCLFDRSYPLSVVRMGLKMDVQGTCVTLWHLSASNSIKQHQSASISFRLLVCVSVHPRQKSKSNKLYKSSQDHARPHMKYYHKEDDVFCHTVMTKNKVPIIPNICYFFEKQRVQGPDQTKAVPRSLWKKYANVVTSGAD